MTDSSGQELQPDDQDVPGYVRPMQTHPYLTEWPDTDGHAHPHGDEPHYHLGYEHRHEDGQ